MTRLFCFRWLASLLVLVCGAALVACGDPGGGGTSPSICDPSGLEGAYVIRQTALGGRSVDLAATVLEARQTILHYHIDRKDPTALLDAAWKGADAEARLRGTSLPPDLQPNLDAGASPTEREARLRLAFTRMGASLEAGDDARPIIDAAIASMAESLQDDHTGFLSKEERQANLAGKILATGFLGRFTPQGVLVSDVMPDSPARAAGLQVGDLIVAVNGERITPETRPPSQPKATYTIQRYGRPGTLDVELVEAPLSWLKTSLIDGQLGYVRLYEFPNAGSCDGFDRFRTALDEAIAGLQRDGARAWVLDLRSNPGGSINAAAYVAGRLGFNGLLATERDARGFRVPFETLGNNAIGDAPLAVLIDQASASSSEVVAYDLQTERDAVLIGERTAGKVVAAVRFPIGSGALQVTFALVDAGPTAYIIDHNGVAPDRRVPLDPQLMIQQQRDSQLEAAVEYLKQKLTK